MPGIEIGPFPAFDFHQEQFKIKGQHLKRITFVLTIFFDRFTHYLFFKNIFRKLIKYAFRIKKNLSEKMIVPESKFA